MLVRNAVAFAAFPGLWDAFINVLNVDLFVSKRKLPSCELPIAEIKWQILAEVPYFTAEDPDFVEKFRMGKAGLIEYDVLVFSDRYSSTKS